MTDQTGSTALAPRTEAGPDRRATVRTEHDVIGFVTRTCFKTGPPRRVGLESEWFVEPFAGARTLEAVRDLLDRAGPLPGGSLVTYEPGGQLELSTACGDDLPHAIRLLAEDLRRVDELLDGIGLRRLGVGVHPTRSPERVLHAPRYDAMERYFDGRRSPTGRAMMTTTAAVQVCVQAGVNPGDVRRRWHRAHALAPVLVAMFAHSPFRVGEPTGWASTRARIWQLLDPARTRPVHDVRSATEADPAEEWAKYALDAPVMLRRATAGDWPVDPGFTLRDWVRGHPPAPAPTYGDVAYHLTTLFPPVRPHAWLELRMVDALPDHLWPVAAAVVTALLDDERAADDGAAAVAPLWRRRAVDLRAARDGVRDDAVHRAASQCVAAALAALPRLGVDPALVAAVDDFADRYVDARRMPADDLLGDDLLDAPRLLEEN